MKEFLLQKDWLRYAENAKVNADAWRKGANGWSKDECEREAEAYMLSYNQSMARAETAPVKIVLHYEDGSIKTIE